MEEKEIKTYVMIAIVSWNMMKRDSGMVPFVERGKMFLKSAILSRPCVAVFHSQNFSEPPTKALPKRFHPRPFGSAYRVAQGWPRHPSPRASEYPNVSQQRVMRDVSAIVCKAVESTPFTALPPWVAGSTLPFALKPESPPEEGQRRHQSGDKENRRAGTDNQSRERA
jgi:hypothetical protein